MSGVDRLSVIRRDEEREAIWLERLRKADQRFDIEATRHLETQKELRRVHQQLEGAVEVLRGVLSGRVVLDETEGGEPILLDLSTEPATVVRLDHLGGQS